MNAETLVRSGSSRPSALHIGQLRRLSPHRLDSLLRVSVAVGAAFQLVTLLARSKGQWNDFALTRDFALFNQVWWQLGHGHLDPTSTLASHPFWQDQFNLTFWPVGLLYPLSHSSFTLLVVQDSCIAGASLVGGLWVCDAARTRLAGRPITAAGLVVGLIVAFNVNPWIIETGYFDFHMETIAAVFLLLAARALWRRRAWSPAVWALGAAASCTAASFLVVGFGLGVCLVSRELRRKGLGVALVGAAVLLTAIAIGADQGTPLAANYGYLAGKHVVGAGAAGALTIAQQIVLHPQVAGRVIWDKHANIGTILTGGGVLGALSGWGIGVGLVDLVVNSLNRSATYVSLQSGGFQNFPAVVLLLASSGVTVAWLVGSEHRLFGRLDPRVPRVAGRVLGALALLLCLRLSIEQDPGIPREWLTVPPAAARSVGNLLADVPSGDEVVVSQGFVGRFGQRKLVYAYTVPHQLVPLMTRQVVFVLSPGVGIQTLPGRWTSESIRALLHRYHGRVLSVSGGIAAIVVDRSSVPAHMVELPPA